MPLTRENLSQTLLLLHINSENALLSLVLNLCLKSRGQSASQKGQLRLLFHTYRSVFSNHCYDNEVLPSLYPIALQFLNLLLLHKIPNTYLETKHMHLLHPQMKMTSNFATEGCFVAEFILSFSVTMFNAQTQSKLMPSITTGNFNKTRRL